jgi:hypothetical protein
VARRLWAEALGERASFTVVTVALGFSGLEATQGGQKGIAAFLAAPGASHASAGASASAPRKEITPPVVSKPAKPRRDGIAAMFQRSGNAVASSSTLKPPSPALAADDRRSSGSPAAPDDADTWQCGECAERLFYKDDLAAVPLPPPPRVEAQPKAHAAPALPNEDDDGDFFASDDDKAVAPGASGPDGSAAAAAAEREAEARRRFEARKVDHSDWHFAMALSAADAAPRIAPSSSTTAQGSAKRKADAERDKGRKKAARGGIRSFFTS